MGGVDIVFCLIVFPKVSGSKVRGQGPSVRHMGWQCAIPCRICACKRWSQALSCKKLSIMCSWSKCRLYEYVDMCDPDVILVIIRSNPQFVSFQTIVLSFVSPNDKRTNPWCSALATQARITRMTETGSQE